MHVPATEVKLPELRSRTFVDSYSQCPKTFWICASLAMLSSPAGLLKRTEHSLLISVFCVGNMFPVNASLNAPSLCTSPITQKQLKEETNLLNEGNNEMREPPNRSSEDPKCQPLMTLKVTKFIHNVLQGSACVLKGQLELFSAGRGGIS